MTAVGCDGSGWHRIIVVQSGWGVDAQRIQAALAGEVDSNEPQRGVVCVFAAKK